MRRIFYKKSYNNNNNYKKVKLKRIRKRRRWHHHNQSQRDGTVEVSKNAFGGGHGNPKTRVCRHSPLSLAWLFSRRSMIINEDHPSHRHHIALPLYWLLRHQLFWGVRWGHSLLTAKMPTWIPVRRVTLTGGRRRPTCLALMHPAWPTGSCSARRFGWNAQFVSEKSKVPCSIIPQLPNGRGAPIFPRDKNRNDDRIITTVLKWI